MSFLRYAGEEEPEVPEPPPRLYARVDGIESFASDAQSSFAGEDVVLLDSVDANWFDEARRERPGALADAGSVDEADRNVSIVAVASRDLEPWLGTLEDEAWLELWLARGFAGEPRVLHYLNLYAPPVERTLIDASWVDRPLDRELADKTSMDDLPDATPDALRALLARVPEPDAVAVYDVGHGNCLAALARNVPALYFDFGGGVLGNRDTFPAALRRFCFTASPPVILSHWDWDHWSSANRDPNACRQAWIVPRQGRKGLGAVHRTFLGRLLQHGPVHVWPSGVTSLRSGAYEVVKCTGPPSSRNDSGLALVVAETAADDAPRMLLPGDCAYHHVPGAEAVQFRSLVVAHHGGRTRSQAIPQPDAGASGRIAYSYGQPNSYGHPFADVRDQHVQARWAPALETPARCPPRGGRGSVLGHVHLYWEAAAPDAHPDCGGDSCQLTCHQR